MSGSIVPQPFEQGEFEQQPAPTGSFFHVPRSPQPLSITLACHARVPLAARGGVAPRPCVAPPSPPTSQLLRLGSRPYNGHPTICPSTCHPFFCPVSATAAVLYFGHRHRVLSPTPLTASPPPCADCEAPPHRGAALRLIGIIHPSSERCRVGVA
jgi:hypothetical protein